LKEKKHIIESVVTIKGVFFVSLTISLLEVLYAIYKKNILKKFYTEKHKSLHML